MLNREASPRSSLHFELLGANSTHTVPPAHELRPRALSVPSWGTSATRSAAHFSAASPHWLSNVGLNYSEINQQKMVSHGITSLGHWAFAWLSQGITWAQL